MGFFTIFRRKVESWIFTEQFIREDRDEVTSIALKLYYLAGGFCFDRNIQPHFKKKWIAYNIFSFVLIYASSLFYLINAPVNDYYTMLLPLPIMVGIACKFVAYTWAYMMRNSLSKLFAFLNQNDHNTSVVEKTNFDAKEANCNSLGTINLKKFVLRFITILSGIVIVILIGTGFKNYIRQDEYIFFHYPMYVPFDKSNTLRFIVQLIQSVTILPELVIFITIPLILFVFGIDVYNSFVFLAQFLRSISNTAFGVMEDITQLEIAMEEKLVPSTLSKLDEIKIRKALAMDEYLEKLKLAIKRYQELHGIAEIYAKEMKYVFSCEYISISFVTIVVSFIFIQINETGLFYESIRLAPLIACVFGIILCWLLYCFLGQKFQEMNEMIAAEVYSSPWYYLEPKDRKLVLTFLGILQRPMEIVVCGLYPVNLSLFPGTVNTMYSNVQILRTLQMKKQKRRD